MVLPITITGLLAFATKFDRGQNWALLRGASESLKPEIFYYRFLPRQELSENKTELTAEQRLSKHMSSISESLKDTIVQ
ncbi:MAG: hypothetical protein AAGG02_10425 [Cyanobacteria bacterium P01_H01_bin.15]